MTSVFIQPDSTRLIDVGSGLYGTFGYDTGNIIANLIFSRTNIDATISATTRRTFLCSWPEKKISEMY
jgi:5-methylthioribose kinase